MSYIWKITDIHADGELITKAKYHCVLGEIETEGYCIFDEPKLTIPFAEVTEEMVIDWVKAKLGGIVEKRLAEQQDDSKSVVAPWMPQVFTPTL
jgi:hypothetical protein